MRTEISSCLITGNQLWLSYDEDAGIERMSRTSEGYGDHKHYELREFFTLPSDQNEVDMEALAYAEPYLWFCGSMSRKRNTPDSNDSLDVQFDKLAEIALDENRFSLGCIPCVEKDGVFELVNETNYNGSVIKARMLRGGRYSSELHNALMHDRHLKDFMTIPCKDNGFNIDG